MLQAARRSPKPASKPEKRLRSLVAHPARLLGFLGPGLITGAANDDPSDAAGGRRLHAGRVRVSMRSTRAERPALN